MSNCQLLIIASLVLACGHTASRPALQPETDASVQVSPAEALIVFPTDPQADFPWPAQALTDRFAGPFWNFLTFRPGQPAVAAAAQLRSLEGPTMAGYPSLAAVIRQTSLYACDLDTMVISCHRPLNGAVTLENGRVVLRITDTTWVGELARQRPDSARLRVDRPNRRLLWSGRVPIRYEQVPGGAPSPDCRHEVIQGRVSTGQEFEASLAAGLVFRLVPERLQQNPPGWTIRVTPATEPDSDYAMVATPPYRFWNPRYLSTSYGVAAEEALARTPREFAFVASSQEYHAARRALDVLLWPGTYTEAQIDSASRALTELRTFPASFSIEGGAAMPPDSDHPFGSIEWLSFRVDLCTPGE